MHRSRAVQPAMRVSSYMSTADAISWKASHDGSTSEAMSAGSQDARPRSPSDGTTER